MSDGDMIPYCVICHSRHYGADCPQASTALPTVPTGIMRRAALAKVRQQ